MLSRKRNNRYSYQKGYGAGRTAGYERGYQEGIEKGRQVTIMPIALIITASKNLPTLKMMIYQPFDQLKIEGLYNFWVRAEDEVSREDIEQASVVIFVRNVEPGAYQHLETAHELGKRTIYCIDDNFLEIPESAQEYSYLVEPVRRETFVKFLTNAQLVHVNSEYFADHIRRNFNPQVVYFPATVDFEWLDQGVKPVRDDGQIVIGYEGTFKEDDFKEVVPAIKRILKKYGSKVKVEFFGYLPAALEGYPGIKHIPFEYDYRTFIHHLYGLTWDIGLAPLHDTLFNNCKTNNKFREYGACKIPGIYSNIHTYSSWVDHEETGYLVHHSKEGWYEGMKRMIEDPDLRLKIKEQAAVVSRENFSIGNCVENWKNLLLI